MTEPEVLTKRPKLEPSPKIVVDTPAPIFTIVNNHKSISLNQPVINGVLNQSPESIRQMTKEELLIHSISSKNSRTKIFSGAKSGAKTKVETLVNLCIHSLQKNIDYLKYTGSVPFDIMKPVLERTTYKQLMTLENFNPNLIKDLDCLWEQHCKRRFRNKRPQEMESWRGMFSRCLKEEQEKFKNLTKNIKLTHNKELPIRKTKLTYAMRTTLSVKSRQIRYGKNILQNRTPSYRVESLENIKENSTSIGNTSKIAVELKNEYEIRSHGPHKKQNKKAPLMAKTLISIKEIFKR